MSGHSKWSTIKRTKGAADAKRGKIFTKLIREIATAARLGGGEPDANPRLRLAIDKARIANMPKDNITRAIEKGIGATDAEAYEPVVYEGYGPGGAAVLVETLTDNKNRTVGEVRHVFTKFGGNLGAAGCVSYLFEKKGLLQFERVDADALLEAALEAGADDVVEVGSQVEVVTAPGEFEAVKRLLEERGFAPVHAAIALEPTSTVALEGGPAETMLALADALEDLGDVQNVSANFDISGEEMARIAG
ncbi:MAG: YebC/PmpR family DNA-binding transcriptional regulator [Myxococcota bacterium]|jgi:YebC/PmpR family DNA-binding regulatory protein|nr:YebC/PmpR family DNA-binding transcriptional regulator [Deltaproteobacteria bacterium]MCP4244020.1 YebC/PmpR family DNA-binding transcriptional regulator [bacterium]MDP6073857.1 YebC/PmpR family DNA-binding transcriptional regulator [Myxococcota bacterium]MDP6243186.1 YebC/PmpR family DNA-binding transcriptional regulator [Myxococcota bacterium]MDP7073622.1 YebC/PmpR family DNA-binding transcriptional regulator [Myxococcota bacterium]